MTRAQKRTRWDDVDWDNRGPSDGTAEVAALRERALEDPDIRSRYDATNRDLAALVERKEARLADIRRALHLTQAQLADELEMTQSELSKLERRHNLLVSTLTRYIEATGGRLKVTAVYDDIEVEVHLLLDGAGPDGQK